MVEKLSKVSSSTPLFTPGDGPPVEPGAAAPRQASFADAHTLALLGGSSIASHAPSTSGGKISPRFATAALGPVHTPRFNLADALSTPSFAARDPRTIPVPQAILDRIDGASTVLLIGHTGPDGDCVGSTLAMQRALEAMGKKVEVVVDDGLTGSLRKLDVEGRVRRASEVADQHFDLALIMDVAGPERIGGALQLLQQATSVAIVDHHVVEPSREALGLRDDQALTTWIEPDSPSASLLAAAILRRYEKQLGDADLAKIFMPVLVGFATDTGFGNNQGLDREYLRYFKYIALELARTDLEGVRAAIDYALPQRVLDVIEPVAGSAPLPDEFAEKFAALEAEGRALTEELHRTPGKPGFGMVSVSTDFVDGILELARLDDPKLIDLDLTNAIKWGRVAKLQDQGLALTAFLIEREGKVALSFRSDDDSARRLAEHLGGGGHDRASGATLHGASLAELQAKIRSWAAEQGFSVT